MTPHINCESDDIAKIVITAGDPKRVQKIVDTYLTDAKLVSDVRGELFYTGFYKNKKITVMSSGMGNPSMGIYSYELFKFYDVDYIIRIGTAGAYIADLNCYDVVLATSSFSQSTYGLLQNGDNKMIKNSSTNLNKLLLNEASKLNIPVIPGVVHSSDVFYSEQNKYQELVKNYNTIAVEMETFALFHNANVLGKQAACLLTISDSLVTGEATTALERTNKVMNMVKIALEATLNL